MTHLVNNAADFADQALDGLGRTQSLRPKVHGGVVQATPGAGPAPGQGLARL